MSRFLFCRAKSRGVSPFEKEKEKVQLYFLYCIDAKQILKNHQNHRLNIFTLRVASNYYLDLFSGNKGIGIAYVNLPIL